MVSLRDEDWIWRAGEASDYVRSKVLYQHQSIDIRGFSNLSNRQISIERQVHTYIHRTDEVLIPHQNIGHAKAKDYCADPSANEAFDSLLWRKLDELRAAKCHTAKVGKDIICDDKGGRKEEPDQALEEVVHHKMRLHNDEVQSHMSPGELRELETVMALLEGANEEDEACTKLG